MSRTVKQAVCEKWRAKLAANRKLVDDGAPVQIPIIPAEVRLILVGQYPSQFAELKQKLDHSEPTHVLIRFAQLESLLSYAESSPNEPAVPADVSGHEQESVDDQSDTGLTGQSPGGNADRSRA